MSVVALGIDWEGYYSCRWCGAVCSTGQWSDPHKKKHCLSNIQELIESGDLVRSPKSRAGDVAFGRALVAAMLPSSNPTETKR